MSKPASITECHPREERPLPLVRLGVVVAIATGVGAAVGASFGARPLAQVPAARAAVVPDGGMPVAPGEGERALQQALEALTLEVRRLAERFDRSAAPREPVAANGPDAPAEAAEWIAALERAAAALTAAGARSGGFATAGVRVPEAPMRADLLRPMLTHDTEDLCVEHAFWSVQRVLDTYGRPTSVWDGAIYYRVGDGATIRFVVGESGYVQGVLRQ